MKHYKFKIFYLLLFFILFILQLKGYAYNNYSIGIINEILSQIEIEDSDFKTKITRIYFKIKILQGNFKNKEVEIKETLSGSPYEVIPKKGIKVVIDLDELPNGQIRAEIIDYYRGDNLLIQTCFFIIIFIIVVGIKNIKSLLWVIITILLLFLILIPGSKIGINLIFLTIVIGIISLIIGSFFYLGVNKRAWCVIFSSISGFLITSLIAIFLNRSLNLGFLTKDTMLLNPELFNKISPQTLFISGIIIGILGIIICLNVLIINDFIYLKKGNNNLTRRIIFLGLMKKGQKYISVLGSIILFLYLGNILSVLFSLSKEFPLSYLFNLDFVVMNTTNTLTILIGIILTLPIMSFITSRMLVKK